MDRSTVIGLLLGIVVLAAALALGRVPLSTLLNPEALLVVFGGTLTATLVGFHPKTIWGAWFALRENSPESRMSPQEAIAYVMDVVMFVRDEGILALQSMLDEIELPFLRKGLMLVLDNRSERFVRDSLSTELEVAYRTSLDHARVFETAGGFAPTMGIIGAVIGLIYVVQAFQNPGQLGKGVASAFSATLYGVALSNLFLLPLAAKLRQRAKDEWFIRTMLLEAVLSIRSGEHPMLVEERLNAFASGVSTKENGRAMAKNYATSPGGAAPEILPSKAVLEDDFLKVPGI
ncbi:MAG TPA: MotA/TolQ/ExbB proton channel family protein [Oculatellaceae cyanobacterium]|jgi:chemotaxis protein MotA